MSISSIITRGFGSWGSVNLVVTRGYSIGEAVIVICPTPLTLASVSSLTALTTTSADILTELPVKLPCVP